jgi:hypothetical protein
MSAADAAWWADARERAKARFATVEGARGITGTVLRPNGATELHGPCPKCGGTDRLCINPKKGEAGAFLCHQCGEEGDLIDLTAFSWRCTPAEAAARLTGWPRPNGHDETEAERRERQARQVEREAKRRLQEEAQRQAEEAHKAREKRAIAKIDAGTVPLSDPSAKHGRDYLEARLGELPPQLTRYLRFHPALDYYGQGDNGSGKPVLLASPPAIVAGISDRVGLPTGRHLTYLNKDKPEKFPAPGANSPKKIRGKLVGGVIRHGMLSEILAIGEGVENTFAWELKRRRGDFGPKLKDEQICLASAGTLGNLAGGVEIPEGVRELILICDSDSDFRSTVAKMRDGATHYRAQGLEQVWLHWPPPGEDWCDCLTREREGRPPPAPERPEFAHPEAIESAADFLERTKWIVEPKARPDDETDWSITSGRLMDHDELVRLIGAFRRAGMGAGATADFFRTQLEELSGVDDGERQRRINELLCMVDIGVTPGAKATSLSAPLFDPWEEYIVPPFPLACLPQRLQDYIASRSNLIGADVSAMAMATLAGISGAIDHRFRVRMTINSDWREGPRLWVIIFGDPSMLKTPIIDAVTAPLEAFVSDLYRDYASKREAYEAGVKANDRNAVEPAKPATLVVYNSTTAALGEILARQPRGMLVKADEMSGWIGQLDQFGGASHGGSADRGFYLKAYDGGTYGYNRIGRGDIRIENLSLAMLGGLQPDKLRKMRNLTDDGLLQRFMVVVMRSASLPQDEDDLGASLGYNNLIRELIDLAPQELRFSPEGMAAMKETRERLFHLEQTSGGLAGGYQSFLGKLRGIAGRLSIVLHLASGGRNAGGVISSHTVGSVERILLDFVVKHALEFYRIGDEDRDSEATRKIASYVLTCGKTILSARDFSRTWALKGMKIPEIQTRLSPLIAGGWLEPESHLPSNKVWRVMPAVAVQFEQRQRDEVARKLEVARLFGRKV